MVGTGQRSRGGLVVIDEGWGPSGLSPWLGRLVLALTGVLVVGTGVVDLLLPLERPKLLGTELAEDEADREAATLWDGSAARLFERDYELTSRVRRTASDPYGRFLMRYLHETSGSVLMGSDGMLFARDRMDYPTDEPDAGQRRSAELIRAVERRFAGHGVRFIALPLPRKAVIERDRLPLGVRPMAQLDRGMVDAIRGTGVEAIDVPGAFEGWEGAPLFRAADTHWTTEGMRLAAEVAARESGLIVPEERRFGRLFDASEFQVPKRGDLLRRLGLKARGHDPRDYDGGATVVQVREGSDREQLQAFRDRRREAWLLTGTSYSTTFFPGFVAHYTGRPVVQGGQEAVLTYQALADALVKPPYGKDESGVRTLPPVIIAEFPGHHLLRPSRTLDYWTYPPGVLDVLELVPARWSTPLAEGVSAMVPGVAPGDFRELSRAREVAVRQPGSLVHSGDGTLELVLDLEVTEPGVELVLICGDFVHSAALAKGRLTHRFPLMGDGQLAQGVQVMLKEKSGASAAVHRADLEINGTVVQGATFEMPGCETLEGGAGLRQEFRLERPVELDRYDCFVLGGGGCFPLREGTVQCFLGTQPVGKPWRVEGVAQSADWALSLGGIAGQAMDRVVLEGRFERKRPGWVGGAQLFEDACLMGLRGASARRGVGPIHLPD